MAMKAKYQKYLDALKGADFSSAQSQFTSGVSGAKNNMKSMQSSLSSWQELASTTVNNETLPMISSALDMLESNGEVLAEVNSKVKELVSSLEALESLENEKDSLGSKWSYTEGGSHTQSEVNSHNNKIDEVDKKIAEQEGTIDGQIAAINGLSVGDVAECYVSATATDTGTETTTEDTTTQTETTSTATGPSGVLSYTVGDVPEAGKQVQYLGRKAVLLDVQVDGNSLGQDGSIVIKKGETVHLKVKVPDEIDNVQTLKRTSADGKRGWSNWVSQKNYPQVNKKDSSTYVNAREYDWYITGNQTTDNITLSQTALFSIPGAKYGSYKGMVRVRVKIVDGGTTSSDDKDKEDDKKA